MPRLAPAGAANAVCEGTRACLFPSGFSLQTVRVASAFELAAEPGNVEAVLRRYQLCHTELRQALDEHWCNERITRATEAPV